MNAETQLREGDIVNWNYGIAPPLRCRIRKFVDVRDKHHEDAPAEPGAILAMMPLPGERLTEERMRTIYRDEAARLADLSIERPKS